MLAACFFNFAKVFDTVDSKILLSKLQYYGIRRILKNWLKPYLINRKQAVNIGNILSGRVPQGSILGPILFYFI